MSTLQIEELFQRADVYLFKEKSYDRAEVLYRQILEREPHNVDGLNSLALCLKHKLGSDPSAFGQVCALYQEALRLDREDVEANFGLAMVNL